MHNIDFARFPIKLHRILEMASNDPELSNVICWLPGGYAFVIKDQLAFSHIVLPIHFASMHSFKSFRRQLNLYGFKKQYNKVSGKREVTGAYGHPLFQRGQCDIAAQICRAANPSRKNKRHRQGSQDLALNVGGKDYVKSEPKRLSLVQVVEERSEHCSNDTRIKSSADIITMDLLGLEKKHDSMIGRPQGDLEKYATKVPPFPDHTTTTSSMACRESHLPDSFLDLSSVLLGNQYRVPNHSSIVVDRDEDDIRTEIIRTFLG